jgi:hypothetical protein
MFKWRPKHLALLFNQLQQGAVKKHFRSAVRLNFSFPNTYFYRCSEVLFCRQIRAEEAGGLLRSSHHRDGLELWLRVCGRQVSSSRVSRIRDSGVADPDPAFGAFFALLITVMAWSFGYEYVVAK